MNGADAAAWDARYAAQELVWGAGPNTFVESELAGLPPGRALDVACGEGRNALWLAGTGWQATGVDFSGKAVERAGQLAERAGLSGRTAFVVGDVVAGELPPGPYDAVVVAYLHLPAGPRSAALRRAGEAVAPGGVLLVVAHDTANLHEGYGGPQDPALLYTASDVTADLEGIPGLTVVRAEQVRRPVQTEDGERVALDVLVRARRDGSG